MKTVYIHRGHSHFDINKFEKVKNSNAPKPVNGGLWASPEDSPNSWDKNVCFQRPNDSFFFRFTLSNTTKILKLKDPIDLEGLPRFIADGKSELWPVVLDFEALSNKFDVIYCNSPINSELDKILPLWESECIVVMNPDVVQLLN